MKVLHISTLDSGGAGSCCIKIHRSLLEQGIDSKVLVRQKSTNEPAVYQNSLYFIDFLKRAFDQFLCLCGLPLTKRSKVLKLRKRYGVYCTLPTSIHDLSDHKLVKQADIIHIHWVGDFLDYPSFFAKVNKPIVMTLHDENLFYGLPHYEAGYKKIKDEHLESVYCQIKRRALVGKQNVNIVFLSQMLYDKFNSHEIVKEKRKCIINNSVDYHLFSPHNKIESRAKLNIKPDQIVFAFMAANIEEKRKGLDVLMSAVESLHNPNAMVLAIGQFSPHRSESPNIKCLGSLSDASVISSVLSAADYFVMPSFQEAFAQSPLEAMACGIPVIAFPCSGVKELITERNGVMCSDFTEQALLSGIREALGKKYDMEEIRNDMISRFSPEHISSQYISLYQQLTGR